MVAHTGFITLGRRVQPRTGDGRIVPLDEGNEADEPPEPEPA
jgi:hypothetical protein